MKPIREVRFALTFEDQEAALHLYRDVLGLEVLEEFEAQGGKGVILGVPSATLELFDPTYTAVVDDIEVGRPLGERIRIAVRVEDVEVAAEAVRDSGAQEMAPVVETPWGDRNQRFRTKDGMQLTLFESQE